MALCGPVWQVLTLKQLAARVLHQAGISATSIGEVGYPEFICASVAEARAASPRRLARQKRQRAAAERVKLKDASDNLEAWHTNVLASGPRNETGRARYLSRCPRPRPPPLPAGSRLRVQPRAQRTPPAPAPSPPPAPSAPPVPPTPLLPQVNEVEEAMMQEEVEVESTGAADSWIAGVFA